MSDTPRARDPFGETGRANGHPDETSAGDGRPSRTPPDPVAEVDPEAFGPSPMHGASSPQRGGVSPGPADPADPPAPEPPSSPPARAALALIRGYKAFVSPLLPPSCRFEPSCSAYGHEAIAKYGIIRGGRLAVWRILRCNPFGRGGYDPVP